MKLIQLNIWQGRTIRRCLPFLIEQDADILCLQEVYSSDKPIPAHWDAFESLELIKGKDNYEFVYFSPSYSFFVAGEKVTFGNAILSKWPMLSKQEKFTKGQYIEDISTRSIPQNQRNVQKVKLKINDKELVVVNHHGHREPTGDGSAESLSKMKLVEEFIGETKLPIIIAGDMNVNPNTPTANLLDKFGTNLTKNRKIVSTMTDLAAYVPVAPDHIIVSEHIKVRSFEVSDEVVSDHKALILEFDL